ncbi:plasmid pRiA4b ORF-3 family protein [Arthrobacter sp. B10-11]|uniref:plasmid pRiA4b ORF-3 family protein n=1 Tax=Arthrobacter sp. B10-11 TaxID=3081160 RepID=UPI0029549A1D|nr:plasmid pRiA4b ORF-3 family protein [Arthrobacter sp. B10-11]MDV8149772.1 plasmid pRiA4b ORF-3 family protein [Arthrobacter sp. B10-11]
MQNVPAFDLRISIADTEPEIWRRLILPETITVPQFHEAVQCAFGWQNRHLYGIRCRDRHGEPRVIVGPDEAAGDVDAESASGVVLFELLDAQETGPALFEYEYDFGDSWTHTVELVGSGLCPEGTMTCAEGANRGPVEDSGGPDGYRRLAEVLANQKHPEFYEAATWYSEITGHSAGAFDVGAFDVDAVNRKLGRLSLQLWPLPVTPAERDAVLRPIMWFLENSAGKGMELTKDGYLKPAMVRRTLDELGWYDEIMGKGNRELNAHDVLNLRQHLLDWKLLRKRDGRMVLGPMGKIGLENRDALWDYMVKTTGAPKHQAVKLMTRLAAHWRVQGFAPAYSVRDQIIISALEASGFATRSGDLIPEEWVWEIDRTVRQSLDCLQLTIPGRRFLLAEQDLSDGGLKFLLQVQALLGDR